MSDPLPKIVPVFPLPDTVLFPRTALPLHIFEPRYRAMVRDVTAGDGLIVIARTVGDAFEDLGTVGRVRDLEPLEDGRFNLVLEGLQRVSMAEVPCDTPYRQVRIQPRPEVPGTEETALVERSKLELLATLSMLLSVGRPGTPVVLSQELPFEDVVNQVCAALPVEAALRQRLLAQDDLLGRHRLLSEHLDVVIEAVARAQASSSENESQPN
jgi:Lon protease-like protein